MKKILFFILFLLISVVTFSQKLDTRADIVISDAHNFITPKVIPPMSEDIDLRGMKEFTMVSPTFKVFVDNIMKDREKPKFDTSDMRQPALSIPFFIMENLHLRDLNAPVNQEWFSKEGIASVKIQDLSLGVAIAQVTRIMDDSIFSSVPPFELLRVDPKEVTERRWVSEYRVEIKYQNGTTLSVYNGNPVRIITNYDKHVDPPDVVPGTRWLFSSALDDASSIFNVGGKYSKDGGLRVDYD